MLIYVVILYRQGLSLEPSNLWNEEARRDYYVPMMYSHLIQSTNPHWPWKFDPKDNSYPCEIATLAGTVPIAHPVAGKLRVGFLSSFFYRHSVGRLLGNVIIGLNRDVFDVFVLADSGGATLARRKEDDVTASIQQSIAADHWVLLSGNIEISSIQVRSMRLDALIYGDLFMDAITAHLAMIRLAPVQIAFWGHPYSSGYSSIDYFISSEQMEGTSSSNRNSINRYFPPLMKNKKKRKVLF